MTTAKFARFKIGKYLVYAAGTGLATYTTYRLVAPNSVIEHLSFFSATIFKLTPTFY